MSASIGFEILDVKDTYDCSYYGPRWTRRLAAISTQNKLFPVMNADNYHFLAYVSLSYTFLYIPNGAQG